MGTATDQERPPRKKPSFFLGRLSDCWPASLRPEGSRALSRIPHGTYPHPSRDKSFSYAPVRGSPRRFPPGRACPWAPRGPPTHTARCCTGNGALAPGKSNPLNSNAAPNVTISAAWLEHALRSEHRSEITKPFFGNPCLAPRGGGAGWSAVKHHIAGQNYPMDPPRPLAEQTSLLPPWCAVSPALPSRASVPVGG